MRYSTKVVWNNLGGCFWRCESGLLHLLQVGPPPSTLIFTNTNLASNFVDPVSLYCYQDVILSYTYWLKDHCATQRLVHAVIDGN